MIQANELRIGNYLKTPEGAFMTVKTLKQDDDDLLVNERNGMFTLNYTAFPIPLTEEILLKCRFVSDGVPVGYTIDNKFQVRHVYDNVVKNTWKWSFEAYDDDNWIGIANPEHLHQLQNLYFALTGKELEVKL